MISKRLNTSYKGPLKASISVRSSLHGITPILSTTCWTYSTEVSVSFTGRTVSLISIFGALPGIGRLTSGQLQQPNKYLNADLFQDWSHSSIDKQCNHRGKGEWLTSIIKEPISRERGWWRDERSRIGRGHNKAQPLCPANCETFHLCVRSMRHSRFVGCRVARNWPSNTQ